MMSVQPLWSFMSQQKLTKQFFARLSSLFEARRKSEHGSIFLTQKRCILTIPSTFSPPSHSLIKNSVNPPEYSSSSPDSLFPDLKLNGPLPVLIRATNGKSKEHRADKIKLSTIVQADQLEGFFVRYAEICKGGMQGMKKRDRSKNKAKAKKRKGGAGEGEKKAS